MSPSPKALNKLNDHWAIKAIGATGINRAMQIATQRQASGSTGTQINLAVTETEDDKSLLERAALAFESAAIEGLDELSRPTGKNAALREQAIAASYRAYDSYRLLPVPTEQPESLFFVLHLSAIACCGDRWSDLRSWYREQGETLKAPSVVNARWDHRFLYRMFDCWIRLFQKNGKDDLNRVREIIARLRSEQKIYEKNYLDNASGSTGRAMALRLAALYNWAKATETLAEYGLLGVPAQPFGIIDKHFEAAIAAATASGDQQHGNIFRWLHAASHIMVADPL